MMKVRPKLAETEARRFHEEDHKTPEELAEWCGGWVTNNLGHPSGKVAIVIPTSYGHLVAYYGWWIIKQYGEFLPITPEAFETAFDKEGEFVSEENVDECTCEPPTFGQEIVQLLNKHSMERYSGTPDWILGNYIEMVLRQFDCAVMMRAEWRGESVELPALQKEMDTNDSAVLGEPRLLAAPGVFDSNDGKIVPLVMYEDGSRNEIGEAKINITPGEVRVTGTINGVLPIFEQFMHEGQYSISDIQHGG